MTGGHGNDLPRVFNPGPAPATVNPPHWHVLGAGAIGCLFASYLQRAGCRVTLVLRPGTGLPADGTDTVLVERDGARDRFSFPVSLPAESAAIGQLLVTTKSYDVAGAVDAVAHRLAPATPVVVLANGMGFIEPLGLELPWLDLYPGTTTEGAYRQGPRQLCHAGSGQTRIGRDGRDRPPDWFATWARAIPGCRWDPAISQALWRKLAINCAINPLTALHRCRNGELARQPRLAAEVDALLAEIAAVGAAAGYPDTASTLGEQVAAVIAGTAGNRSSMLQDIEAGRRTEIDAITGYLVALADTHRVAVPRNRALLQALAPAPASPR